MPVDKAFSVPLPAESQLQWRALIAWLALVHAEGLDVDGRLQALEASEVKPYTPTLTNVTLGNGSVTGWWQQVGGVVTAGVLLTCGSSTAFTGNVQVTLPVPVAVLAEVAGHGYSVGPLGLIWARMANTTVATLYVGSGSTTVNGSTPIGAGSRFAVTFTYRAA